MNLKCRDNGSRGGARKRLQPALRGTGEKTLCAEAAERLVGRGTPTFHSRLLCVVLP